MSKGVARRSSQPKVGNVSAALGRSRGALLGVAIFSALVNILALTGSLYMLQLYDRVLPSHNIATLVGITAIVLFLYVGFGIFDVLRTLMLNRISVRLERDLRPGVVAAVMLLPLRSKFLGDGQQPVRDLDNVKSFLSGMGPTALFDLPWVAFYLGLVYFLHPWLGLVGAVGALFLIALTLLTEIRSRGPVQKVAETAAARQKLGEATCRNAEVVRALGMNGRLHEHWDRITESHLTHQVHAAGIAGSYGVISRVFRMMLQSAVLGLGAYLVIDGQATAGVMIAASILVARALAPIEIAIANWRGFVSARQSAARLRKILALVPAPTEVVALPRPQKRLSVEGLLVAAPGEQRPILQNVSFKLEAGDGLGVIGPAAAGKSTLVRALVGAWLPLRGVIRLDDAALDQWTPEALGQHIGYLPQDIELFAGTVAENIARFDPAAESAAIIDAATQAGVHSMILRLPEGYQTQIGEGGATLSAGQRQRIALARALYGNPFLLVLDEPNSNLDASGDEALAEAIGAVRRRGGIVVVVTHRQSVLTAVDNLLVLGDGQIRAFGPKEEVLRKTVKPSASVSPMTAPTAVQLKVMPSGNQGGPLT